MDFDTTVHAKAVQLIKLAIEMTAEAGSGHPTSAASLAHIVTVLMYYHMRYGPEEPDNANADRLVLSEGHACPIIYATGADLGIAIGRKPANRRRMTRADALKLRAIDSEIDGHPNPQEGFPFFPAATGSLGQGLSIAAGLALAARLDAIDRRVFCIIGDGESREGQIWEALDFIQDYHLTSVCPIFNCNGHGQSDRVSHQQSPTVIQNKLSGAGYEVIPIDGHNPSEIKQALDDFAEALKLSPDFIKAYYNRALLYASKGQADATFDPPGSLAYGQTYYWRIDEVNKTADGTTYKGNVWSFTVEPYGYPITGVTATASSSAASMGPEKTIDGSGLTGDLHGTEGTTMWLSGGVKPNWIQYQFDKVYKLFDLKVWNSNQLIEGFLGFGAKKVTIEYSTDGGDCPISICARYFRRTRPCEAGCVTASPPAATA